MKGPNHYVVTVQFEYESSWDILEAKRQVEENLLKFILDPEMIFQFDIHKVITEIDS